ncbi:hypothetical protein N0B51_14810, partial [Tsuneonella sp. YG55]
AGTTIALDTTGAVTAGGTTAGGALTIGSTVQPASVLLTGDASAASVDIRAAAGLTAQDITATSGGMFLLGETIVADDVRAAQDLLFATQSNAGTATFGSLTSTNGIVAVSGLIPSTVTVTGPTSGTSVFLYAINELALGNVTATNGNVYLDSTFSSPGTGKITAGNVSAAGNARIVSSGDITTTAITASTGAIDVDSTGGGTLDLGTLNAGTTIALDTTGAVTAGGTTAGGALTVGAVAPVASATFTGNVGAASVDIDAVGAVNTLAITATAGMIDIDAGSVAAGALKATGDV